MASEKKIRVVLSKSIQDAHEYGIRYLAGVLRDEGMEVIFTRYGAIDEVVNTAVQEDADVIALSFFSSGMMYEVPRVLQLLKERDAANIQVIVGGTISKEERTELLEMGVTGVFMPGVGKMEDIAVFIKSQMG